MNNIEEYQNIVELLKQALWFYANNEHYKVIHAINNELFSYVEMDSGTQARFALNKLRELEELKKKMEDEFTESIKEDALQEKLGGMLNTIEEFKKLGYGTNNNL